MKFSQLNQKTQRERFEETARELECDEDEDPLQRYAETDRAGQVGERW